MTIKSHKDLEVYKESMELVTLVYRLANTFPSDEKFGLTSQIKRAAISIPSNLAEGAARKSSKEFIQFLHISLGSLSEIETQLDLAHRLGFVETSKEINEKVHYLFILLTRLISSIKKKVNK